jgi:hypothetical protein
MFRLRNLAPMLFLKNLRVGAVVDEDAEMEEAGDAVDPVLLLK